MRVTVGVADSVLTPSALAFVEDLTLTFRPRIDRLLQQRRERQARLYAGERLRFLPETFDVRTSAWQVAACPPDLRDRRVEIRGPVDGKTISDALGSGARVFIADLEDATSSTWANVIDGQRNLRDAVCETIAPLMVRPRGLHLPERHLMVDGRPAPGALVDFGLFFFHNARHLVDRGSGPYFYIPKLESYLEARLWNDVFLRAQELIGLPRGTIRAAVVIETLPAAFEMEEILYELREHSAGLCCGPILRGHVTLLIETCHSRGAHAIGEMAAHDALDGLDGTSVAHPGLVAVAQEVFDRHMPGANQIHVTRPRCRVTADDLYKLLAKGTDDVAC
jgi:malate synthase